MSYVIITRTERRDSTWYFAERRPYISRITITVSRGNAKCGVPNMEAESGALLRVRERTSRPARGAM